MQRPAILLVALATLLPACGNDAGTGPTGDTLSPAAVTDLAAESSEPGAADLTWTAPGDDGSFGRASRYDLRYAPRPITEASWDSASVATSPPVPKPSGQGESFTVTGLRGGTWYFATRTADEVPNWSGLSNVANAVVVPPTPPLRVTDLGVESASVTSITLTWTAPGDVGTAVRATAYDLRFSPALITPATWDQAFRATDLPVPATPGNTEHCTVAGLTPGVDYFFALRASDEGGGWSELSNVVRESTPAASLFRLTHSTRSPGASHSVWSPDGQTIAFASASGIPPRWQLYLVDAGGGVPAQLTNGEGASQPAWSPDGRRLAFVSFRDGFTFQELSIVDALPEAESTVLASHGEHSVGSPSWSPDGSRIAYHVVVGDIGDFVGEIYTVSATGGAPELLVSADVSGLFPSWSSDGSRILFSSNARNKDVWVVAASGGAPEQVTDTPATETGPEWSPDGSRIAFSSNQAGNRDIWVMSSTGENPVRLTTSSDDEYVPSWSPDGRAISLTRRMSNIEDIWVLRMP